MFGRGTQRYFDQLPELPSLTPNVARRVLSSAYTDVLAARDDLERRSDEDRQTTSSDLRRLASALESYAVFVPSIGLEQRRGAAFVAAEALSLHEESLTLLDATIEAVVQPRLRRREGFQRVEAGLLYFIAGLEANGATLMNAVEDLPRSLETGEHRAAEELADAFVRLLRLRPTAGQDFAAALSESGTSTLEMNRIELYRGMSRCIDGYLEWLRSDDEGSPMSVSSELRAMLEVIGIAPGARYADVLHLSALLLRTIEDTSGRALRAVPRPGATAYVNYIRSRALERPLFWPSAERFVRECLPGPHRNAVVNLPTGSGKSFIAELAVSQAATEGWVLYLVPTNALAAQVRRDLSNALRDLPDTSTRAFLGGAEYTLLDDETVGSEVGPGEVLVMTPEKCALALRRAPSAFRQLALCIFDECHLLGESGERGVLAELVVAHIACLAPEAKFCLFSAMVENPAALAAWMEQATGRTTVSIEEPWRPTRTLRGVVGLAGAEAREAAQSAARRLSERPERRVNESFDSPLAALLNLQGPWSDTAADDYSLLGLETRTPLKVTRRRNNAQEFVYTLNTEGYLNPAVARLVGAFKERGERVLAFVPRSRHDPFAVSALVAAGDATADEQASPSADRRVIDAYLTVAEIDLGAPSELRALIDQRITLHSSTLLEAERVASEIAYQRGTATAMIATGTLAQGLNLPSTIVLVAGTKVGRPDDDEQDDETDEARIRAQLLNAIGRAGRAGFANHGSAFVLPNKAVQIDSREDVDRALSRARILASEDASFTVRSRLDSFVVRALDGSLIPNALSTEERVAYAYLPAGDSQPGAAEVLSRTYGIWARRQEVAGDLPGLVAAELERVGDTFFAEAEQPGWLAEVAYRAGISLPVAFAIRSGAHDVEPPSPGSLDNWVHYLTKLLRTFQTDVRREALDARRLRKGVSCEGVWTWAGGGDDDWSSFSNFIGMYLRGASVVELAALLLPEAKRDDFQRSSGGKPIPKTIVLIQDLSYRLSLLAGAVGAFASVSAEFNPNETIVTDLASARNLSLLPVALRSGCGTPSSLAWYRYGIRYRGAAHALARFHPLPDEDVDDAGARAFVSTTLESLIATPSTDEPELAAIVRVLASERS